MAGGIDWFRWHHGSVTDPKFGLVAKKAGARSCEVIAMWAFVLEAASSNTDRGYIGEIDSEAVEFLLGLDEGMACRILDAMAQRGLINTDGYVESWDRRQAKRERDTDCSTERTRAYRERRKTKSINDETIVTPCDATERQCSAREEKRREEVNQEAYASVTCVPQDDRSEQPSTQSACPAEAIVDLYHTHMPDNPRCKVLNDSRRRNIRTRWKEAARLSVKPFGYDNRADGLKAWADFFAVCAESAFLTGRSTPMQGKPPFIADIDFLMSPSGFAKTLENKYHRDAA